MSAKPDHKERRPANAIERARRRLKQMLALCAVLITLPIAVLIVYVQRELKKESFFRLRNAASELVRTNTDEFYELLRAEAERPAGDYNFFVGGQPVLPEMSGMKFSPLSSNPPATGIPGLLGYFQLDTKGELTSPLLPAMDMTVAQKQAGLFEQEETARRIAIRDTIRDLVLGRVTPPADSDSAPDTVLDRDVMSFALINEDFSVFYRHVATGNGPLVQGFVVEHKKFFARLFPASIYKTTLGIPAVVVVQYGEKKIFGSAAQNPEDTAALVVAVAYEANLARPVTGIKVRIGLTNVPEANGLGMVYKLVGAVVLVLLCCGAIIYWLMNAHLKLALEKSNFASVMSHELKTPVSAIRMYGEMLQSNMVADEEKRAAYYAQIQKESERLSRLVTNVLEVSKLERNAVELDLQPHNPSALINEIGESLKSIADMANISLKLSTPQNSEDVVVFADKHALTQIFSNLVENSIKFSKDVEDKVVTVGYRVEARGNSKSDLVFFVADNGPGIPPKMQKKIFDLFYRSEDEMTRKTPGTGIGLALVRELAERMGASASASNPETGAEIDITFREARLDS